MGHDPNLGHKISSICLLLTHTILISVLKAVFLVNVITCSDNVAMWHWPSRYKRRCTSMTTKSCQPLNENYQISQTKVVFFFSLSFSLSLFFLVLRLSHIWQNFLNLRNTSQKMEKFEFTRSWRLTLRYKSHKRSHSTELRLMQKYVNARIFTFISLNH